MTTLLKSNFEGMTFTTARETNLFYDTLDQTVTGTGRTWYFLGRFIDCEIKPGAALQIGIRRNHAHALSRGAVRYGCSEEVDNALMGIGTDVMADDKYAKRSFRAREEAIQCIEEMKAAAKSPTQKELSGFSRL